MKLQVLFDEDGRVVGTAQGGPVRGKGKDAPEYAKLVPQPGQQIAEIDIDDAAARQDAVSLHARLRRDLGC